MKIETKGKKTIIEDGKDRFVTNSRERAKEICSAWIDGERLPKPKLKTK